MWGAKNGCVKDITTKIVNWGRYQNKGIDQDFLRDIIWKEIKDKIINHSSLPHCWGESVPFPKYECSEINVNYVGEIYNENNKAIIP
jgi:hypothetical protein